MKYRAKVTKINKKNGTIKVNVRLFNIQGAEDMIVDSVGMSMLSLPDITTYIPSSLENKITIKSEQIQKEHYQNILQLLSDYSVQLLSYGDYGLEQKPSIRGFTDETVRVVIDGVCMKTLVN